MASGDSLHIFKPGGYEPPASAFAAFSIIPAATGQRPVLLFDDTIDETAVWSSIMNRAYGGGGLTVTAYWAMVGANTTKTMSVDVAFERVIVADALGGGGSDFAAANNANVAVDDIADKVFSSTETFTDGADMDSVAAGEPFRMRVTRDANGTTSTDDAVGDAQLIRVEVKET